MIVSYPSSVFSVIARVCNGSYNCLRSFPLSLSLSLSLSSMLPISCVSEIDYCVECIEFFLEIISKFVQLCFSLFSCFLGEIVCVLTKSLNSLHFSHLLSVTKQRCKAFAIYTVGFSFSRNLSNSLVVLQVL